MSNITTILIALIMTKVIDFKNLEGLDIVIIILFVVDVIVKTRNYMKGGHNGKRS